MKLKRGGRGEMREGKPSKRNKPAEANEEKEHVCFC